MQGIGAKKLQYRAQNMQSNSYFKWIRAEVEAWVIQIKGQEYLKTQALAQELSRVVREINASKRKLSTLENLKAMLVKKIGIRNAKTKKS
jgi:hypothetical protein